MTPVRARAVIPIEAENNGATIAAFIKESVFLTFSNGLIKDSSSNRGINFMTLGETE